MPSLRFFIPTARFFARKSEVNLQTRLLSSAKDSSSSFLR